MEATLKAEQVKIYVNSGRKTPAQVRAETGADYVINGGLYDMATFKPVCHLKVDGQVLAKDQWTYWGYGWSGADLQLMSDYSRAENYIACACLVRDGKKEPLYVASALKGARQRTALGVTKDGKLWIYADTKAMTPEQLQEKALALNLRDCLMLDGGASTQWACAASNYSTGRAVHNYICVWEKKTAASSAPGTSTSDTTAEQKQLLDEISRAVKRLWELV